MGKILDQSVSKIEFVKNVFKKLEMLIKLKTDSIKIIVDTVLISYVLTTIFSESVFKNEII